MVNLVVGALGRFLDVHAHGNARTGFEVKDACAGETGVVAVELGAHEHGAGFGVVVGFGLAAFMVLESVGCGFTEFLHLLGW